MKGIVQGIYSSCLREPASDKTNYPSLLACLY